jgi:hypothetical protein
MGFCEERFCAHQVCFNLFECECLKVEVFLRHDVRSVAREFHFACFVRFEESVHFFYHCKVDAAEFVSFCDAAECFDFSCARFVVGTDAPFAALVYENRVNGVFDCVKDSIQRGEEELGVLDERVGLGEEVVGDAKSLLCMGE